MSAIERNLMAMLLEAEKPTPAEKALWRVVSLFYENDRMSRHELRIFEIALEGLGLRSGERRVEIEAAIQRKRDRLMALRAERGDEHAIS
ncbi:hypothetical protein [Duganella sp. BJB475]|uniref:hypothetical protein n=1 Tax=Duganella sp. BJB475 TaxID=2233914 RepID=UPI000E349279|nr:hypothetical protein [Duganella sp. BJB475]RFP19140.1 hypothetical protein D0T23_04985 [Duganella sp. BJB475]